MSLYNGPPRGGARGGKDQFNWENVKSDKDREFYLGHSVKASVGRWQKGKDLFWYSKEKKDDAAGAVSSELATVKAREEELMLEALGLKKKTVRLKENPQLNSIEMKRLLEKGEDEEEPDEERTQADQIKGIGFRSGQVTGAGDAEREVMAGVGVGRAPVQPGNGQSTQQLPLPPKLSVKELKKLRKSQKRELEKAEKRAKKAKRAAKKEARKAKRALKRQRDAERESSSSSDDSEASASPPRKRPRSLSAEPKPGKVAQPSSREGENARARDTAPKRYSGEDDARGARTETREREDLRERRHGEHHSPPPRQRHERRSPERRQRDDRSRRHDSVTPDLYRRREDEGRDDRRRQRRDSYSPRRRH